MEDYVYKNLTMESISQFNWTDYLFLTMILLIPIPIAIYYGFIDKQQNVMIEYLLGGRNVNIFPVAFSLVASFISSLTITGIPAEVYVNGTIIWLTIPSTILACIFSYYFFLPIFYELNIISAYHYLELRFNASIRSAISIMFIMTNILILPTFIHIPSLLLSEVTGINIAIIATGLIFICFLYSISGFRALIWTGFTQIIFILIICFLIVTIGTFYAGGISNIFHNAFNDGKLNIFKMDPNPFQRESFWTITIGTFFMWASGLISSQTNLQKLMSLKSIKDAKITLIVFLSVLTLILSLCIYAGLVLYSTFYGCDPIEQEMITRPDQIFPYFVVTKMGHMPAISGVFMAAIFLAAICTYTNSLNAIAFTIYEDFLKPRNKPEVTDRFMLIWIMVIMGMFTYIMVVINSLDKLLMLIPIIEVVASSISLVFIMGMMIPIINASGATVGIISNIIFLLWISIGGMVKKFNYYSIDVYPNTTNTCREVDEYINVQDLSYYDETYTADKNDIFIMYKLSHMLYLPAGIIVGIIFGVLVSLVTKPTDLTSMNRLLISPPIRRFLPKNCELKNHESEFMMDTIGPSNTDGMI